MSEDNTRTTLYDLMLIRTETVDNINEITDFAYLIFIRQPGTKQSSYIIAQANIPLATLILIEHEASVGLFPNYQLQIRHIVNGEENLIYSTYTKFILPKNYNLNQQGSNSGTAPTVSVQFLLVNPIAWNMNTNNSFNFVFNKQKYIAMDIIEKYYVEEIKKKHSGNRPDLIKFQNFADNSTKNTTLYNQITIPSSITELQVPEYMIDAYKPYSTPSLWLFDTFNFGNYDNKSNNTKGEIPIWCIMLNFYNAIDTFKKYDISNDLDITQFTSRLKIIQYNDTLKEFIKPNAVVSFTDIANMTQKIELFGNLPFVSRVDNTYEKQPNRTTSLHIKYNDNLKEAERRIVDCVELMNKQINQIEIYETINTSPEWLQFGCLYNFDRDPKYGENLFEYVLTPITIFNIFRRKSQKDTQMEHMMKYAMLRFNSKSPSSGEWICDKSELSTPVGKCTYDECIHYRHHKRILHECPNDKDIHCPHNKFKNAECK